MNAIYPRRIIRVYTCPSQGVRLEFPGDEGSAMALGVEDDRSSVGDPVRGAQGVEEEELLQDLRYR